ncbi:hypothetical protein A6J66_003640 [Yersinia enterocolitica]|nr:hypothetical protein A6J66_003640 [Yersinia enterocolitica]
MEPLTAYILHISSYRCVGRARLPESLTLVSSSGFSRLPPSCTLRSIGYISGFYSKSGCQSVAMPPHVLG